MKDAKCLNPTMRRQDRTVDGERACEVLRQAEWGTLALIEEDGAPYAVPVNFVWDGADAIYIHGALEGHRLDCLRRDGRACFNVAANCVLNPGKFTESFDSVTLRGRAEIIEGGEALEALRGFIRKYSPDFLERGMVYAQKAAPKTTVVKLAIESWSAKHHP